MGVHMLKDLDLKEKLILHKVENFQFILWLVLYSSYTHLVFFLPLTVLAADKTHKLKFLHKFLFNDENGHLL